MFEFKLKDCSFDISDISIPYYFSSAYYSRVIIQNLTFLPKYHPSFFQFMIRSEMSAVMLSDFELSSYWNSLILAYSSNVSIYNCYFSSMLNLDCLNGMIEIYNTAIDSSFFYASNLTFFNISTGISPIFYSTGNNIIIDINSWNIFNYSIQNALFMMENCLFCSITLTNITIKRFIAWNSNF